MGWDSLQEISCFNIIIFTSHSFWDKKDETRNKKRKNPWVPFKHNLKINKNVKKKEAQINKIKAKEIKF